MLILQRLLQQHNEVDDLIPPRRESQLPEFPLPTDDYYIYRDRIQPQPHGQLSVIEGFCVVASMYCSYHSLLKFDLLDDDDRLQARDEEIRFLKTLLQHLDSILSSVHPELAALPSPGVFNLTEDPSQQQTRQHLRWETQKIVLRFNLLNTRFYLTGRLATVQDSSAEPVVSQSNQCLAELALLMKHATPWSIESCSRLVVWFIMPKNGIRLI